MSSGRVDAELECPVCLERFETPRILPCQHTFCTRCLQEVEATDGIIRCPECRAEHPGPANTYPTNVTIQRLLSAPRLPNVLSSNIPESRPRIQPTSQPTAPSMTPSMAHQPIHDIQTHHQYPLQYQQPQGPYIPSHGHPPYPTNFPQPRWSPPFQQQPLPRIHEENGRNNVSPTHVNFEGSTAAERIHRDDEDECDCTSRNGTFFECFVKVRQGIRKVMGSFFKRTTIWKVFIVVIFLVMAFGRLVAGAVKLSSDCDKEKRVAEYLFAKSWFAFLFWGTLLLLLCRKDLVDCIDSKFTEVYVAVVDGIFSLIWLIVGTAWTIDLRQEMIDECPLLVEDWNKGFITFAMVLVIFDWIAIGILLICCLCILLKRSVVRNNQ